MSDKFVFNDVEELVSYMFDKVNTDDPVTVAADKDLTIDVLSELLTYKDVALELAEIDTFEYDREYYVTLLYDEDVDNCWRVSVEKAYNDVRNEYFGTYGYILFHEDINSKILVDIQNNENVEMSGHDWFIIGEDNSFKADEDDDVKQDATNEDTDVTEKENATSKSVSCSKSIFTVNGKEVEQETYNKALDEFDNMYLYTFGKMLNPNRVLTMDFINGYPIWMWV